MSQEKNEYISVKDQAAVINPTASAIRTPSHLGTPLLLAFVRSVLDVEPSKVNLNQLPAHAEFLGDVP
jgi:hypothetical protein